MRMIKGKAREGSKVDVVTSISVREVYDENVPVMMQWSRQSSFLFRGLTCSGPSQRTKDFAI